MPITIQVPDHMINSQIEFYQIKLDDIAKKKIVLEAEEKFIVSIIEQLRASNESGATLKKSFRNNPLIPFIATINDNNYKREWNWTKKVEYILASANGKLLSTSEIADIIRSNEPNIEKRNIVKLIAVTLYNNKGEGKKFKVEKNEMTGEFLYGLNN